MRETLMPPPVLPAQAPMNITPTRTVLESAGQQVEICRCVAGRGDQGGYRECRMMDGTVQREGLTGNGIDHAIQSEIDRDDSDSCRNDEQEHPHLRIEDFPDAAQKAAGSNSRN